MEKKVDNILLYETYKSLLTKNMQDIFEQYYYLDLSLREIGENKKISYQAVRDSIKNTEKQINEYEDKLKLCKIKKNINDVNELLNSKDVDTESIKKIMSNLGEI